MWKDFPFVFLYFLPFFFNFWPPSIGLSLISSIANECLFFSFNKYLYKNMTCIQPSFLRFYLFQPRQNNTSLLLTSKGEIKYPGGSFPKQPTTLILSTTFPLPPGLSFAFSIVNERTLFIYLFGQLFLPQARFDTESIKFSGAYHMSGFCIHTP